MISDSLIEERLQQYIRGLRKDFQASFTYCQDSPEERCVHDCRVFLRRWITLCDLLGAIFQKTSPSYVLYRKKFRKLHKALGPLRDLHVSLSYLRRYEKLHSPLPALIKEMECEARNEHLFLEEKLRMMQGKTYNKIQKSIKHEFQGLIDDRILYTGLKKQVSAIYKNTRSYVNKLCLEDIESFHSLRINLKKLRYTLEFLNSLDGEKDDVIQDLKDVHDELGAIQDFEILGNHVSKILDKANSPETSSLQIEGQGVHQWIENEILTRTESFYRQHGELLDLDL